MYVGQGMGESFDTQPRILPRPPTGLTLMWEGNQLMWSQNMPTYYTLISGWGEPCLIKLIIIQVSS